MQTSIPDLLKPYGSVFSKPQFNHFSQMIGSLAVCEKPSLSRFAEIHNKDRSSLNRFLTESPWEVKDVKCVYHQELNKYLPSNCSLLIDDCISHRPYAVKVEKANWHYDHTIGKQALGYNVVTSVLSFQDNIIPYNLIPYYRKDDCKDREFLSKNDIVEKIILSTKNNDKVDTIIFDTWYSNERVINACKESNKHYITQIKSNRNVTIYHKKSAVSSCDKYIKPENWEYFTHGAKFRIFATSAFISGIGNVHLVFSQMFNDYKKEWGETRYIISDMVEKESKILVKEYLTRVGIEGFHREAKQNTGLEGYLLRNNRGIEKYLFLVMLTYATLVMQKLSMKLTKTIGEMCEENKIFVYEKAYERIQQNPEIKQSILRELAKARV